MAAKRIAINPARYRALAEARRKGEVLTRTVQTSVDPDTLRRDVSELVESLIGAGLLERARDG